MSTLAKYHLRNILDKLHVQNRTQVVAYAVRQEMIEPRLAFGVGALPCRVQVESGPTTGLLSGGNVVSLHTRVQRTR